MYKTLVIGGASPIGYGIAVNLKKRIRTCIQVVDDKDLTIRNENYYINFEKFIHGCKSFYNCDLIVINLYDLLGINRFQSNKYQLYLKVFNVVIEIIKNNTDIKIIVIANSHLNKHIDEAYNERFNSLNSYILGFLKLFSAIKKLSFQTHLLPILNVSHYIDDLFINKDGMFEIIDVQEREKDFTLMNNVLSEIVERIVSRCTCYARYTLEIQVIDKLPSKSFHSQNVIRYTKDIMDDLKQLEFVDYLKESNMELEIIESDCRDMINNYRVLQNI